MGAYFVLAGLAIVGIVAIFRFDLAAAILGTPRVNDRRHGGSRVNPYHAVAISPCEDACNAVKSLAATRMLVDDAQQLPVPACDRQACNCTFEHFNDRRQPVAERRRRFERRAEQRPADERRCGVGRRRSDWRPLAEPALS